MSTDVRRRAEELFARYDEELRALVPEGAVVFDAHTHVGTDIDGFVGETGVGDLCLRPGDHMAFCLENHPRFFEVAWGAHYAGLRGKPEKRARLLDDYRAKRGPVEDEVIARPGGQTVRVGAAVAAPEPAPVVVAVCLFWGFWVIADSAQFSALVSERAPGQYVGGALALQLALGFSTTVFTLWLVPALADAASWHWALAVLAVGPAVGACAMAALMSLDRDRRVGPR